MCAQEGLQNESVRNRVKLSLQHIMLPCLTELTPSWNNQHRKLQVEEHLPKPRQKGLQSPVQKNAKVRQGFSKCGQKFPPRKPRQTLSLGILMSLFLSADTCNSSISVADHYSPSLINTIGKHGLIVCFPVLFSLS